MTLVIVQIVVQSMASTLHWLGLYFGIRALAGSNRRRWAWIFGSAAFAIAWLFGALLLASDNYFRNDVFPAGVPLALGLSLIFGYTLLLSSDFRTVIGGVPEHWLIGVQVIRILGGVFLIRWRQGDLAALFAIPAGMGDVMTGLFAPVVAYWWYTGRSNARSAAIAWNLFGMTDLVVAVTLGSSILGSGMALPSVMIPIYAVPRGFLIHSYSLIGLLGKTSKQPTPSEAAETRPKHMAVSEQNVSALP
jgi:hypothetical protein